MEEPVVPNDSIRNETGTLPAVQESDTQLTPGDEVQEPSIPAAVQEIPVAIEKLKKSLTLMSCYRNELWTQDNENIATDFLSKVGPGPADLKLFAFVNEQNQLILQRSVPSIELNELVYYLRDAEVKSPRITDEVFDLRVQYGLISGNVLECLLQLMQSVYTPYFSANETWPENVRREFSHQLHRFMAFLTDSVYQRKGCTILYVPQESITDVAVAAKSKDVVQRCESSLIHWTRQIKDIVSAQHSSKTNESSGIQDEVRFWKKRCEDLNGINEQLTRPDVLKITEVLRLAKSSYLDQFTRLSNLIQDGSTQATDNLKFLSILSDPCQQLSSVEVTKIPPLLPKMLNCIRFIWTHAKYYNTDERITALLRQLSYEIIHRCSSRLELQEIFQGDSESCVQVMEDCLDCCDAWKQIYDQMCQHIAQQTKKTWNFDKSTIFAQVDAFMQRCRDLIEICEGQAQFARKGARGKKAQIPIFGGSKGPEVMKGFEDVENTYERLLQTLWSARSVILDVKAIQWHENFGQFKRGVRDLEVRLQNLVALAFEEANTFQRRVELTEVFYALAKKDTIKRFIEKKISELYQIFNQEITRIRQEFEKNRQTPELLRFHPDFAGSAMWARFLSRRLRRSNELIMNSNFVDANPVADATRVRFDQLITVLDDYVGKLHHDWTSLVQTQKAAGFNLNQPLLTRRPDNLLVNTFNRDLNRLLIEAQYWQKMHIDPPQVIQDVVAKKDDLRLLRESDLLLSRDYNAIIESLSPDEQGLFKDRIRFLDRKIHPGLTTVTWSSRNTNEQFIRESRRFARDVQTVVMRFSDSNSRILKNCMLLAETLLCHIENKRIYTLEEFEEYQSTYQNITRGKLQTVFESVKLEIRNIYEVFRADSSEVQSYWALYVEKVDRLVEDALRIAVKRSLQEISKAINGENKSKDGSSEIYPIFKVNVILENQKIEFAPTLSTLEERVNTIARNMISTITVVPRLSDTEIANNSLTTKQKTSFYDSIVREDDVLRIFVSIQHGMSDNTAKCQAYVRNWDSYREIWEINKDAFIRRYAKLKPALSTFDADINRYHEVANNALKEETYNNIKFVRLDCSPLKHTIVSHCNAWQEKLTTLLNTNAFTDLTELIAFMDASCNQLRQPPLNLDQLSELVNLINRLRSEMPANEARFAPIHEQYQILDKYEVAIKENERAGVASLEEKWSNLLVALSESEKILPEYKIKFKTELMTSVDEYARSVTACREDFAGRGPFESSVAYTDAQKLIEEFKVTVDKQANHERNLRKGLAIFKIDQAPSKDLEILASDIEALQQVWGFLREWNILWNEWKTTTFLTMDSVIIKDNTEKFSKKLSKLSVDGKDWQVLRSFKDTVSQFTQLVPVLQELQTKALRDRHWSDISQTVGRSLSPDASGMTMELLCEISVEQFASQIAAISQRAREELSIEETLKQIETTWHAMKWPIVVHRKEKNQLKITSLDEMKEKLEDCQITLSAMKTSKHFRAFEKEVFLWEKNMAFLVEIAERLTCIQRSWLYLENIFVGAEDIRRQLPRETFLFESTNTSWQQVLSKFNGMPSVLESVEEPRYLDILADLSVKLEKIEKSLDAFLETKRQVFSRLYFLSNDELLELFGQIPEPKIVQPYLKKCFGNIHRLEISKRGSEANVITGMYADDGEYVPFVEPVHANGPIESWLADVEIAMRATLKASIESCLINQRKLRLDRWIDDYCGQILSLATQIMWTMDCSKAIEDLESGLKESLTILRKRFGSNVKKLIEIAKSDLGDIQRKKLSSIAITEVYNRDVIDHLTRYESLGIKDFEWERYQRFFFNAENSECTVTQFSGTFQYAFEYLGNTPRLVVTPLTERAYSAMALALTHYRGSALYGPAGTGKTESIRDYGRSLGKYVLVQNCAESLNYKSLHKLLTGVAQSGVWVSFDEFFRIDAEVISAISMQLYGLFHALSRKLKAFVLDGREIKLDSGCGVFLSFNPTDGLKPQFPDSLKNLFRPIALVVPDSQMIIEISLLASGFDNCHSLAKKLMSVFQMLRSQLSDQPHYHFGLRGLVACLRAAALKKREDPMSTDEWCLFHGIKDAIIPKLITADMDAFSHILHDNFPGVDQMLSGNDNLRDIIQQILQAKNYQLNDDQISKIMQLYEVSKYYKGVILIGENGSGKSTAWNTLRDAMNHEKFSETEEIHVNSVVINPRATSNYELFGGYDRADEWKDGILPTIIRSFSQADRSVKNWVVLDGPISPTWIESMNSALDQSQILSLANGERIPMNRSVLMMFETTDLGNATPPTISRCGIVHFEYVTLGWQPFFDHWLSKGKFSKVAAVLKKLKEKYLPKVLAFRNSCSETYPITELHAVKAFCKTFDAIAQTSEFSLLKQDDEKINRVTELCFIFSLVWSIGSLFNEDDRKRFDLFLRDLEAGFPGKGTVFDYMMDPRTLNWATWEEKTANLPRLKLNSLKEPYVFTPDSHASEFLMRSFIAAKLPVLVTGVPGVGKTTFVNNILDDRLDNTDLVSIPIHSHTTASDLRVSFDSHLEKKSKNTYVPLGGKHLLAFLDDLNTPVADDCGSQQPLEMLKYFVDYGGWIDPGSLTIKQVENMNVIATINHRPHQGYLSSSRLQNNFVIVNLGDLRQQKAETFLSQALAYKLQDFEEEIKSAGDMLAKAAFKIHKSMAKNFLYSPSNPHYLFDLRDMFSVYRGVCRASKEFVDSRESFLKLWINENSRVYVDRLADVDKSQGRTIIEQSLRESLDTKIPESSFGRLVFSDALSSAGENKSKIYQEIADENALTECIQSKIVSHASTRHVVLFQEAVDHICRISRSLREYGGDFILLGPIGSGRQTLTEVSCVITDAQFVIFPESFTTSHPVEEFLKNLCRKVVLENSAVALFIRDNRFEDRLVDVSKIVEIKSTTDYPRFIAPEELPEWQKELKKQDNSAVKKDPKRTFIDRLQKNLHIVLSLNSSATIRLMSDKHRGFVRSALIDTFDSWSEDALMEVSRLKLEQIKTEIPNLPSEVSKACATIHRELLEQIRPFNQKVFSSSLTNFTAFLGFLKNFQDIASKKTVNIRSTLNRLVSGTKRLGEAEKVIEAMTKEMEKSKKDLMSFQRQCEEYLVVIVQQKRETDEQGKVIAVRSEKLKAEEEEVRAMANAAEADLSQALSSFLAATKSLEAISKKDLQEIKSYAKPPPLVEKVLEAIMILRKSEPTWEEAKKQLSNQNFINQLIHFDKDNMSDKILKRISQICADPEFTPENVGKISSASKSLCVWVRACEEYGVLYRQLAPKRERLQAAKDDLTKKQTALNEQLTKLQELKDRLANLTKQYDEKVLVKEKLKGDIESVETKLIRANQLTSGLIGERERWSIQIAKLEELLVNVVGDSILAAAFVAYLGSMNVNVRSSMIKDNWIPLLQSLSLSTSANFAPIDSLVEPHTLQEWINTGLPNDFTAKENAAVLFNTVRWPLLTDPQNQAFNWLQNLYKNKNLVVLDAKQEFFARLEQSIKFGMPTILYDVRELDEPRLSSLLKKRIVRHSSNLFIQILDKEIPCDPNFKLFLITKLPSSAFMEDSLATLSILNFAITEQALGDRLLNFIIRKERPELHAQKETMEQEVSASKLKLNNLAEQILTALSSKDSSFITDDSVVEMIKTSKSTYEETSERLLAMEQNEKKIDLVRELYRESARRLASLYFAVLDMSDINRFYETQLNAFMDILTKSLEKTKRNDSLVERLKNLCDYHSLKIFRFVGRSMMNKDRILFAFQIAIRYLLSSGKLNRLEYEFFIQGQVGAPPESETKFMDIPWLDQDVKFDLKALDDLQTFRGILRSVVQEEREWKEWYFSDEPELMSTPGEWDNKLDEFQKLIVLRVLRPDRTIIGMRKFVSLIIGKSFTEGLAPDLEEMYGESKSSTPILFILSAGTDPLTSLQHFASKMKMEEKLKCLSLGQMQALRASRLIEEGMKEGHWIYLANLHQAVSWLPELDLYIDKMNGEAVNPEFRLWLSTEPIPNFSATCIRSSVKAVYEPPSGLKPNLLRLCGASDGYFNDPNVSVKQRKIMFSLVCFHSFLAERKRFGSFGWAASYDFDDFDYNYAKNLLDEILHERSERPWTALHQMIAETGYCSRVSDDWDRKVIMNYAKAFFTDEILIQKKYSFSFDSSYYIPDCNSQHDVLDYIETLPNYTKPELLDLHANAAIISQRSEVRQTLTVLSKLIEHTPVSTSDTEAVIATIEFLSDQLPLPLEIPAPPKEFSPVSAILAQEARYYNSLVKKIQETVMLMKNIAQKVVPSSIESERMRLFFLEGMVPVEWLKMLPTSSRTLSGWVKQLFIRVEYLRKVLHKPSQSIWLGALSNPVGYISAALQSVARQRNLAVDSLHWESSVIRKNEPLEPTAVVVEGLYLEGAAFDADNGFLTDARNLELETKLPVIVLRAVEGKKKSSKEYYCAPIYSQSKKLEKERTLITTVDLAVGTGTVALWTKRGVSLFCS